MTLANDIPSLPSETNLSFLAEGAANIVYRIHSPSPASSPISPTTSSSYDFFSITTPPPTEITPPPLPTSNAAQYEGQLLRLRKHTPARTTSVSDSYAHFNTLITPLFAPSQLVQSQLIRLPPSILARENATLKALEAEGGRDRKRHGVYLDEGEGYGTLVTDMTAHPSNTTPLFQAAHLPEEALEFKPKWLIQSPTAPEGSTWCRTCALHALRSRPKQQLNHGVEKLEGTAGAGAGVTPFYCPLKLVSTHNKDVEEAVNGIVATQLAIKGTEDGAISPAARTRVVHELYQNELLLWLMELQREYDTRGVLKGDVDEKVLVAMAIRDCTFYLKVPKDPALPVEARLGDLDLKPASQEKVRYWRETELELIEAGWYMPDSSSTDVVREREGNGCFLASSGT